MASLRENLDAEKLGRKRFLDGKEFRKLILAQSTLTLRVLQDLLASNYPDDSNTNIGVLYRSLSDEFARLKADIDSASNDKFYDLTRIEYIYQILGSRLYLFEKAAPSHFSDVRLRQYYIAVKDAYLKGATKKNIEESIADITGQAIRITELYQKAREPGSSYGLTDTHKMIFDVFVDELVHNGINLTNLNQETEFFVNLIKPAHVLYDTRFIWREIFDVNKSRNIIFGDSGGGCVPLYDYLPFSEPVYLAKRIHILNSSVGSNGRIDTIHHDDLVIYLTDGTKLIFEPGSNGTKVFDASGRVARFEDLEIGQYVYVISEPIPGDFQFWWLPPELQTAWSSRFYKNIYQRPIFQENVKKIMDANGRFPLQIKTTPTTVCDRWVQDLLDPQYEDMRKFCKDATSQPQTYSEELTEKSKYPNFSWPWPHDQIYARSLLGDDLVYDMPNIPLTDGTGGPATPSDIQVQYDGTALTDSVSAVDSSSGEVQLTDSTTYWDSTVGKFPIPGEEFVFDYYYSSDGTDTTASSSFVYGVSHFQMPNAPLTDATGSLACVNDIAVTVDNTSISDAVVEVNAMYGHVTLNSSSDFWTSSELGRIPTVGDEIGFSYFQGHFYDYSLLFDDVGRVFDGGFLFDGADAAEGSTKGTPTVIGYKYRAYLLHHTSVLNSPDTLRLNHFQKPAKRASLINQQDSVNHLNLFFSAEFLEDKDPIKVLNDAYLDKDIEPVLKLREGTPPFQKTFSYHPGLVYSKKLQDIRQNHELLLYSDLLLKEFVLEGDGVPLSSICDNHSPHFKIGMKETIPSIEECPDWILFDAVEKKEVEIALDGDTVGVPNLRVPGKNLRDSFILRERAHVGTGDVTYNTLGDVGQTNFILPEKIPYRYEGSYVELDGLPILKDASTLADPSDVTVTVEGSPATVSSLNPLTGEITLSVPLTECSEVVFNYKIKRLHLVEVIDLDRSRVFDNDDVFASLCPDPVPITIVNRVQEYINSLSDYGQGIKKAFLNKDTYQVEEYVFTGPLFELHNAFEDEIAPPASFPNALVKVLNLKDIQEPMGRMGSYSYIDDPLVRFRRTTYKELLPNRTFRTTELVQMLPL